MVDVVVLNSWLDLLTLEGFSKLGDSVIPRHSQSA